MPMDWKIIVLFCSIALNVVSCQVSEPLQITNSGESCAVINLRFSTEAQQGQATTNRQVNQGPPGKIGPAGRPGNKGNKGDMGRKGAKGEQRSSVNTAQLLTKVAQMSAVSSCGELKETYGITVNGYYQLRLVNLHPTFVYCDFTIYEDTADCSELQQQTEIINGIGHYLVRQRLGEITEIVCNNLLNMSQVSTCHELQEFGIMQSGYFTFRSPSVGDYQVYCSFTGGKAITQVSHHDMNEVENPVSSRQRCGSKGCYSWTPRYLLARSQISGIVSKSSQCRQHIKARCVQTMLLGGSGGGHAWWVSREGERMNYWGGATSRRDKYCACGETGTCINNSQKCNCDTNSGTEGTDEGYLTDKTKLPVRELRFGDLDDSIEFIWSTLGMLECWGKAA